MMKVMIVDDSKLLQVGLMKNLMKADHNLSIRQAFNCKDALELFPSFNPDAVILDIDLPDGSGIDLLQNFKKEDRGAEVIIFTNYPTNSFKEKCMQLGADHFIDKSDLTGLINTIRNYSINHNV